MIFSELNKNIAGGFNVTKSVAEDIKESGQGREVVKELRDIMLDFGKMEGEIKNYMTAAEKTKSMFLKDRDGEFDLPQRFQENLKSMAEKNKLNDEHLTQHKEVNAFLETVWSQHYWEAEPTPANTIDDDDELQMT